MSQYKVVRSSPSRNWGRAATTYHPTRKAADNAVAAFFSGTGIYTQRHADRTASKCVIYQRVQTSINPNTITWEKIDRIDGDGLGSLRDLMSWL